MRPKRTKESTKALRKAGASLAAHITDNYPSVYSAGQAYKKMFGLNSTPPVESMRGWAMGTHCPNEMARKNLERFTGGAVKMGDWK